MGTLQYAMFAALALIAGLTAWAASRFEVRDDRPREPARPYEQPRWLEGKVLLLIAILITAAIAGVMVWLARGPEIGIG